MCFNKNDLSEDDKTIEKVFSIYQPLGYDILFTSALEGYGIDEFKELLRGKTSVLCGSSGVGKSSLINAVCPGMNLRTKEVSEKTQRGTHTTRHCEIISIDEESRIVDTPGFSNLKFDFLMPNEVDLLFDEIAKYKRECKFQDCLHNTETGCAVKEHLEKYLTAVTRVIWNLLRRRKNIKRRLSIKVLKRKLLISSSIIKRL